MNKEIPRLYFLDIVKILTLIAIMILHTNEFIFYTETFPHGWLAPVYNFILLVIARPFTLGGQILVAIIYFLFGLTDKSKRSLLKIAAFAFLGQLILAIVFQKPEWDIYIFLAFCNFALVGLPRKLLVSPITLIVSFLMIWIPSSFYQSFFSDNIIWDIVSGRMSAHNSGSWPLLPWLFHSIMFFNLGLMARNHYSSLTRWHKSEYAIWPICLLFSLPFIGAYYWVPVGANYYNFVFNQPPHIYWANFWYFAFFIRLAFLDSIQLRIKDNKFVKWISSLAWTNHLGIVYLISIIYLGIGMMFDEVFLKNPKIFDLFFVSIFIVCELSGRLLVSLSKKIK